MPQVYHLFIAWCLPVFITAYTCPTGTQSVSLSYLSGTANGSSLLALTTQNGDPNNGTGPTNLRTGPTNLTPNITGGTGACGASTTTT